ncbi:tRNA1(Val) (adenine(37)-N6)-methyltransferase [Weissella diestrammenae]|uniref:tRNA1(Val) (Adenine(37)-N6)-methyltransferase n=1 Tax=Weissella diestrammenae TaxID=1162633 RepID=A0A7G9T5T8_9LACO|nr:tRNA1(Val) (adenine(37)-N6)-methyltransferase [Weissella diestrammenae]MCM0582292.1 tRNA1(Val) (adenine(37)-N6)-methyltransferase [Weissella diestrammenae]QNN75463.1 tRNA1(Val) (adenine(37)-N6)-methyltransferase [Weissella diestrammenae]
MTVELRDGERIDMLYRDEVKIIQSRDVFSFSLDAVLLAHFANPRNGGRGTIVDLGTGNGAIPLFMAHKVTGKIIGIEIQPRLADMAQRSVMMNELDDKIKIINADMRDVFETLKPGSVETVVSNPPYFAATEQSHKNPNQHYAIARHEIKADLALVTHTAKKLLKSGGHFFMVHRPDRLFEILDALRANNLIPKRVQFVYPKVGREANIVLIEAIKNGRLTGTQILPPIVTHHEDDTYRDEVWAIYEGRS